LEDVWRGLNELPGVFGPLFKIILLTGQRRGEVAGMTWEEVKSLTPDDAVWELPRQRTKNGQAHFVPLTPAVQAVLTRLPRAGSLVFSTTDKTAVSGFSKAKKQLDGLINDRLREQGFPPLPAWTLHDLRRTMVTVMNERLGVAPHVVEAVVNHVSGPAKRGVAGVYNRALYLNDRRDALLRWAAYLERH
jgi:integrase